MTADYSILGNDAYRDPDVIEARLSALQERAEEVADRHWRTGSLAFAEWFVETQQDNMPALANIIRHLVGGDDGDKAEARAAAVRIQQDWQQFVTNATDFSSWPLARQMYREVRNGF